MKAVYLWRMASCSLKINSRGRSFSEQTLARKLLWVLKRIKGGTPTAQMQEGRFPFPRDGCENVNMVLFCIFSHQIKVPVDPGK